MAAYESDRRVVMTLDAGGTNMRFGALRGRRSLVETVTRPSEADDLDRCLRNLVEGFTEVRSRCPEPPVALSFGFPGPADYPNGIITDPPNMPAFRSGVPLGPLLEERFGVPVFIHNDGHLFVYGEAIAGLLPYVNELLRGAGRPRRFTRLFGVTLGTGFGGGVASGRGLEAGDNSVAGEIRLLRNKLDPRMNAEEGASIRAVRRAYARQVGVAMGEAPEPREIFEIGTGVRAGDTAAAIEAFRRLGEVAGDAIAQASALIDGLVVVGGGLSAAWPLFLPALIQEMNATYEGPDGEPSRRLTPVAFNLEDPDELQRFVEGETRTLAVPGSDRRVAYDALARTGVGVSRLGTSEAVAVGAYVFALEKLDASG